jgi:hypothetical protein
METKAVTVSQNTCYEKLQPIHLKLLLVFSDALLPLRENVHVPHCTVCGSYLKERNDCRFLLRDAGDKSESLVKSLFTSPDCVGFLSVLPKLDMTLSSPTSGGLRQQSTEFSTELMTTMENL